MPKVEKLESPNDKRARVHENVSDLRDVKILFIFGAETFQRFGFSFTVTASDL